MSKWPENQKISNFHAVVFEKKKSKVDRFHKNLSLLSKNQKWYLNIFMRHFSGKLIKYRKNYMLKRLRFVNGVFGCLNWIMSKKTPEYSTRIHFFATFAKVA